MNTKGMPRFNSQDPSFGQAAQHNADVLKGRKFLLQSELDSGKDRTKQINKNRYHNTKN